MKKYLAFALLFLNFFAFCVIENFSQTFSKEETCFSTEEIVPDTTFLPKNYHGNDLNLLSSEIRRRGNLIKNEFETTPQFRQRVEKEKSKPLIAELDYNSVFAFEISDTKFQYDADNRLMTAELKLDSDFNWSPSCQTKEGYVIVNPRQNLTAYLPIKNILIDLHFEIEIEKAKKSKPNLRTLLLTRLHAENGMYFSKGRYSYNNNSLRISIQEVWIYDVVTGEIFIKKNTQDVAKLQKEKQEKEKEKSKRELSSANSFYKSGLYEEALSELRKVLVSEPMNAEAYLLLGKIYLQRGDFEQTVSSLKTALFWDNQLIDAHIALGKIYLDKNDCTQANTYLTSASEIDKENQEVIALQRQVERCYK